MSQARKSNVGARRGPQKAHVPYRADDLERGRKTGISVNYVNRDSDEFEPFDKVLTQADVVTPPHMRARKKPRHSSPEIAEHDEDGEMSMELDDTNPDSPGRYFRNAPRPSAPASVNRSRLSSKSANRTSDATFNRVPSPRPSSSRRQSVSNRSGTPASRSRSSLHQSHLPDDPIDNANVSEEEVYNNTTSNNQNNDDSSPAIRRSFTQIDQDEEDEEQDDGNVLDSPSPMRGKGSRKDNNASLQLVNDRGENYGGSEEEVDQSFEEMQMNQEEEGVEPDKENISSRKTARQKKVVIRDMPLTEQNENVEVLRRGTRTRYRPLEWWRLEKVVYGRRESGAYSAVPVIKSIVRLPKEEPKSLGASGRKRKRRPSSSNLRSKTSIIDPDPEGGWDDNTEADGMVMNYLTNTEILRRVAFTGKMVNCRPAMNNAFLFQKIFGDADFIAAGQLVIPPGKQKPNKPTRDNTYVFYVIEGAVNFHIHTSTFLLATGGMFLIPRGNQYYIENVCKRDAKLFFAQARKVPAADEDPPGAQNGTPRRRASNATANGSRTPGEEAKESVPVRSSSMAVPGRSAAKVITNGGASVSKRATTRT